MRDGLLVAFPGGTHDPHLCLRSCRRCARGLPLLARGARSLWSVLLHPASAEAILGHRALAEPAQIHDADHKRGAKYAPLIFALGTFTTWMLAIAGIALALDMNVDGGAPYLAEYNGFNTTGEAMWAMYFWTFATNQPFLQRDNAVNGQHPGAKQNTLWLVYLSVVTVILTLIIGSLLLTAIYESFSKTRGRFLEKQHADSWKLAHAAFEKIDKAKQGTVSLKVVQRMFFFIRTEHSAETAAQHAHDLRKLIEEEAEEKGKAAFAKDLSINVKILRRMLYCFRHDRRVDYSLWNSSLVSALTSRAYERLFSVAAGLHTIFMFAHMYRVLDLHQTTNMRIAGLDFWFVAEYFMVAVFGLDALLLFFSFGPVRLVLEPSSSAYAARVALTICCYVAYAFVQESHQWVHYASWAYESCLLCPWGTKQENCTDVPLLAADRPTVCFAMHPRRFAHVLLVCHRNGRRRRRHHDE